MAFFKYKDKKVFYREYGTGQPLLMLHGNSVSSKMFDSIIDLYEDQFKVILIDFLGHGQSDRIKEFPIDFWYDQGMQVIAFCEQNGYKDINILGTSGGALAGINVALEHPDLVSKLIADSFEGVRSIEHFAGQVQKEREASKVDEGARNFFAYMHGDDWMDVVDADTDVIIRHHKEVGDFFHKDISELKVATLLTGSKEDEYCPEISELFKELGLTIQDVSVHIFESGSHPSVMTSAEEFANIAKQFLSN
ncbi:alpha/beta hydrolase [Acidaminobacter sp. JC074]|uniref:alpha/beta fold hydrolase n=1 Tax=Acidaminobacter sp. JC074 TaxID=2530199 RepID=UPI001F0E7CC4|nr:alpha/beta hydrolase [Acidaminobacter sp. JC074]MCH4887112.1 alpha/beta hydrolase [Acidaminobacter sp. JC074]